jgi:hypothetical protein
MGTSTMTPAETYEKMAKETGSKILARLYRERAAALKEKESKKDD